LRTVREAGGIGDIGLRFLCEDGVPVRSTLDERVIGIELEQLQRVPRAIGVAGGPGKTAAIRAALLGGWINCLITDRFTGERLLEASPQAVVSTQVAGTIRQRTNAST
jgi:DNA-binding transcriptional regulator LsrR (DeoR family)